MGNIIAFADEKAIQPDYPELVEVLDNNADSIAINMRNINTDITEIYILSPDQVESLFQGKILLLGGCNILVMEGFE